MTQVQPPADVYYNGLRFSPDGNYFYFVRSDPGNAELKFLYRAPLLGGTPQKLAADVDSNITFSPDGRKFAFMRYDNPEPGKYRLIVRPVEGGDGDESVLARGSNSQGFYEPAWSPDGKTIVCDEEHAGNALESLVAVDVGSGRQKVFSGNNEQPFVLSDVVGGRQWIARPGARAANQFHSIPDRIPLLPGWETISHHPRYQHLFEPQRRGERSVCWRRC